MNRRTFLQESGYLAAGITIGPGLMPAIAKKGVNISVQLYSVRDDIFKDAKSAIAQVAKIGYTTVEGFGLMDGKIIGMSGAELKAVLNSNGLTMPSTHAGFGLSTWDESKKSLNDGFKKSVEAGNIFGLKEFIAPYMADSDRTPDNLKKLCEVMNRAGEYCKAHGMTFGYHNHDFEFKQSGNRMIYEAILQDTDPKLVKMQMDLYWVVKAGQDPIQWIMKYPKRFTSFHVKDMAKTERQETVEVGEGSIDFAKIFAYSKKAGAKRYTVELEHYKRTPMEGIGIALGNLKKILG